MPPVDHQATQGLRHPAGQGHQGGQSSDTLAILSRNNSKAVAFEVSTKLLGLRRNSSCPVPIRSKKSPITSRDSTQSDTVSLASRCIKHVPAEVHTRSFNRSRSQVCTSRVITIDCIGGVLSVSTVVQMVLLIYSVTSLSYVLYLYS